MGLTLARQRFAEAQLHSVIKTSVHASGQHCCVCWALLRYASG
jgi:hypothetical protein